MESFFQAMHVKQSIIDQRNKSTNATLEDGTQIDFLLLKEGETVEVDDEYDDRPQEQYILTYEKFIENNHQIEGLNLADPDDIVLNLSECYILFKYPVSRQVTIYKLRAKDEMIGFTRAELALAVMQRYHLMVYLYLNYDIEKGKVVSGDELKERDSKKILYVPFMYEEDWTLNGVTGLKYCEELNQWEVLLYNYA